MSKSKFLIILSVFIFVFIILGVVCFYLNDYKRKNIDVLVSNDSCSANNKPDMRVQDFSIKEILKNKKESLILRSKEGRIFNKENKIECDYVRCKLQKNKNQIAKFKSNRSFFDREKKEVFFKGDVKGLVGELKILGKDISYNFVHQKAATNQQLDYFCPAFNVSAQNSILNLEKNLIEMDGGIKCEILNNSAGNNSVYGFRF
ncbi:LPS export ABC transporter periplasmic protein LptC [Candidatus Dependentiae bacterium]|nr:LPS export ABC transporter periplasmic protein LptC [Candidatus Dependentiae bacterium]